MSAFLANMTQMIYTACSLRKRDQLIITFFSSLSLVTLLDLLRLADVADGVVCSLYLRSLTADTELSGDIDWSTSAGTTLIVS